MRSLSSSILSCCGGRFNLKHPLCVFGEGNLLLFCFVLSDVGFQVIPDSPASASQVLKL